MRLEVLGHWGLLAPDASAPALTAGKPLAALSYLGCSDRRSASRASLVSLLWADLEPEAARHSIRQTLWYLKRKVGEELIVADGDTLSLAPTVTVDRDELLAAARAGDHERVVALYTGPFIPNFATPGGAGFEEWADLERRRLLELFRHSAESVIASELARGRARDAIALARRLRDQDPYTESGWRLLIEVCLSAGDALAARAEAEALLQLAARDEAELEPSTRAIVRATRAASHAPEAPSDDTIHPSLVGREEAYATLLRAWESARAGRLTRVHVSARAGLGKSRLLRDFAARVRAMRGKVVLLGGSLGAREIGFTVAGELAAGLAALPGKQALSPQSAATLVDLNPTLSTFFDRPGRSPAAVDLVRARALALRELILAVSFESPVAVLIDDMHWWDDASTATITAAIEGVTDARILLVTTGRPEARTQPLAAAPSTTPLVLDPLSADHIEELLLTVAALPPEPWAARFPGDVWRASRGSPLLALELLQHLEEQGVLHRAVGEWGTRRPEALQGELQHGDVLRSRLAQLDRGDAWLLVLLATAGTVLEPETLVAAAGRGPEDVAARLTTLEGRGLVVREGRGWRPAHDEIAEEALRAAAPEVALKAASLLGGALGTTGPVDEGRCRRAMQLLRAAGDRATRADVLRRYAGYRYASGDRRPVEAIARELLGGAPTARELEELSRDAPLTWRLRLVSSTRRMAAVALGLAVAVSALAAFLAPRRASPPDAVLALAFVDSTGRVSFESVELREAQWAPQDTLQSAPWSGPAMRLASGNGFDIEYDDRAQRFVTAQAVGDSGVIDLFVYDRGGAPRRFLPAVRDDLAPDLSPDGQMVAFSTARWDSLSRYDVAIARLDDTVATRLTSGPSSDATVYWGPDGDRVAFGRSNWGERPNEVCVAVVASAEVSCVPIPRAASEPRVLGWLDRDRLVVRQVDEGSSEISVLQWSTRDFLPALAGAVENPQLSPDGKWLFCTCSVDATGTRSMAVVPLASPALVRPLLRVAGGTGEFRGVFWVSTRAGPTAMAVRVDAQPLVRAGVAAQLRATVRDERGRALATFGGVRWRLEEAGGGTIDSITGRLVTNGTMSVVRVTARAGSAVSAPVAIAVDTSGAQTVMTESWGSLAQWIPYGEPAPSVGDAPGGARAFYNNGDGSFESGAIGRAAVRIERGAALEVELSTPITLPQWQTVALSLERVDTAALVAQPAGNPIPFSATPPTCSVRYPHEGRATGATDLFEVMAGPAMRRVRREGLRDGGRWTLRLQLLPDGRCGVAVNGRALVIVDGRERPAGTVHVRVGGNSYRTRVAVGGLRVVEGVLTDVDWGVAEER